MKKPEILPTRDNVLLKKVKLEETRGGIIIPENSGKHIAVVEAVGPDVDVCKVGDEVKVSADPAHKATIIDDEDAGDDTYVLGSQDAVIALVRR